MKLEVRNLKFSLLALLMVSAGAACGFEATMTVQPPLIDLSESATLSIEVRGAKNPQPPPVPNIPGLQIVSAGQTTQMNWINGRSDNFVSFNYTVYPKQTGTFSIGPFDYRLNGESQKLGAQLKVVSGSSNTQQAQSWSDILFARLQIDRTNAYVQEPFDLTLSIYSRQGVQMAGNINLTGMPETGLGSLQWQEAPGGRDVVNNVIYDVRRFQARTRAVSSGNFEFAPVVTAQVVVPNQNNRGRDPFFSSFFDRVETRPVELPVEKITLTIKPLPETNRPSGFGGAVGRFDFKVNAGPLDVRIGDPVTVTLTISGDGNFDRVMPPTLPASDNFRLFGDAVRTQTENSVQFEQVISPRNAGMKEIPEIPFSFFDTESGQYRTIRSSAIPITVTATSNSTAQVFAAKESVVLPPPETPFATESDVQRIESALQSAWNKVRPWLWTLPSVLLAWLAVFVIRKLHQRRKKDTARVRRQKAPKAARKALRAADHARKKGDKSAFYDALWNALADYFGHRLNLQPGEVTASTVLTALSRAKLNPEQINSLREVFDQVEASRYGHPGQQSEENLNKLQTRLEQILKQCEKEKL